MCRRLKISFFVPTPHVRNQYLIIHNNRRTSEGGVSSSSSASTTRSIALSTCWYGDALVAATSKIFTPPGVAVGSAVERMLTTNLQTDTNASAHTRHTQQTVKRTDRQQDQNVAVNSGVRESSDRQRSVACTSSGGSCKPQIRRMPLTSRSTTCNDLLT